MRQQFRRARSPTGARGARRIRSLAIALAATITAGITVSAVPASADPPGSVVAHVPVTTALYGQAISITFTSTCPTSAVCSARIWYRTTVPDVVTPILTPAGFGVAPVTGTATTVDSQQAILWSGEIPGGAVTTAGVDYFLEAEQNGTRTLFPGEGTGAIAPPVGTYLHVTVVSPPLVNHAPVPFAVADQAMGVDAQVSCESGNCSATIFYRRTPSTAATDGGWSSAGMSPQEPSAPLGPVATAMRFHGEVPGGAVDTTGVDYYIVAFDGHVKTYHPGTPYQGYYVPTDGTRPPFTHHHVHVLEPPRVVHEPHVAQPYRTAIPILAQTTCPAARQCQATLYYRTTPPGIAPGVIDGSGFSSTSMSVTRAGAAGVDGVVVQGSIPSGAADTRGVDYFLSVTDGTTTSWWPGTSAVDGPGVWVNGVHAGYHHTHVLEPVHLAHVPVATAAAFQPLVIETALTCATEACSATLHYTSAALDISGSYQSAAMSPQTTTPPNPGSRVEVWRAEIPAGQVTTRGLAYYITASDGYTNTAAPGTSYWGAYVPVDGQNPAPTAVRFTVRVVDPPHPVHAPRGVAFAGEPFTVDAMSNCATQASCSATLRWGPPAGAMQAAGMRVVSKTTLAHGNSLAVYQADIPAASVSGPAIQYSIEVTDGYVTETTPPFVAVVTARPDPGSQGTAAAFVPPVGVGALGSNVPLVVKATRPDGTAFNGAVTWCAQAVASASTGCLSSGQAAASGGTAGFSVQPTAAAPTLRVTAYADGLNTGSQDPTELTAAALVVGVDPPSPPELTTLVFTPPAGQAEYGQPVELPFRAVSRDVPSFRGTVHFRVRDVGDTGSPLVYDQSVTPEADGTGRIWVVPTESTPRIQVVAYADSAIGGVSGSPDATEVAGAAVVVGRPTVTPPPGAVIAFAPPVAQGPAGSTVYLPFKAASLSGAPYSGTVRYSVRQGGELPVFDGEASSSGGEGQIPVTLTSGRAFQVFAYADVDNSSTPGPGEGLAAGAAVSTTPTSVPGTVLVVTNPVQRAPIGAATTVFFTALNHDGSPFVGTVRFGQAPAGSTVRYSGATSVGAADGGNGHFAVVVGALPVVASAYADRSGSSVVSGAENNRDETEITGEAAVIGT